MIPLQLIQIKLLICEICFLVFLALETVDLYFDTSNVTNMNNMFSYCRALKSIDLSSFNTENVKDMSLMFYECSSLESIDLSSFNKKNVKDKSNMFDGCLSLKNKILLQ